MQSYIQSYADVAGALLTAGRHVDIRDEWFAHEGNPTQRQFLPIQHAYWPDLAGLINEGMMKIKASNKAAPVNKFFADAHLPVTLTERHDPDVFYAGSIIKVLMMWAAEGTAIPEWECVDGNMYPAANMSERVLHYEIGGHRVARLHTKKPGDSVLVVPLTNPPPGPFGLYKLFEILVSKLKRANRQPCDLWLPMAHVQTVTNIDWLVNMWNLVPGGPRVRIIEAKQAGEFALNEKGALGKSGAGVAATKECLVMPGMPFHIRGPYAVGMVREGFDLPLFTAFVGYDGFKRPPELDTI